MFFYQAPACLVNFLLSKMLAHEVPVDSIESAGKIIAYGEHPMAKEIILAYRYEVSEDFIIWISSLIPSIKDEGLVKSIQTLIKKSTKSRGWK